MATLTQNKKVFGGLNPTPEDKRDFQLGAVFVQPDLSELPDVFLVDKTPVKDQGETDLCTAYASTSASEKQENTTLSPEFQFAATKLISGDPNAWGANLRDAMMSFVKYGSLEQAIATGHLELNGRHKWYDRDWIAQFQNWPDRFFAMAEVHQKRSIFKNTGKYDVFDNMCTWLWKFRDEKRSFVVGAIWRQEWTSADGGVIPETYGGSGFGHAFEIVGFDRKRDVLVAKLSNGENIGDKGYFYFPRSVVNRELERYGQYMFQDMPKDQAREYNDKGIKSTDPWIIRVLKRIKYFIMSI